MNIKTCIRVYFLLCAFLITLPIFGEGFLAGTVVCTPEGYVPIEELSIGDQVITCDFNTGYTTESIVDITSYEIIDFLRLTISDFTIEVACNQQFLVPLEQKWVQASRLKEGVCLLGAPLQAEYVESIEKIE